MSDAELAPCVGEKMRGDCLYLAVEIERTRKPEQWKRAIEAQPDECQPECREYLAMIWRRLQVVRGIRK
jgi:hypothetical protein